MIDAIDFLVVAQKAKQFHSLNCVDEKQHTNKKENKASTRDNDGKSLKHLLSEGNLVEH